MWKRKDLKRRAKDVLRTTYWKAFLVSIILIFVGSSASGGSSIVYDAGSLSIDMIVNSDDYGFGNDYDYSNEYDYENDLNYEAELDTEIDSELTSELGTELDSELNTELETEWDSDYYEYETVDIDWSFLWEPYMLIVWAILLIMLAFGLAFRFFLLSPLEVGSMRYFKQAAEQDANLNNLGYAFGKGRYVDIVKTMFWRGLLNFLWYLLLIIPGIVKFYAYSQVPYILADNPNIGYKRAVRLSSQMTRGHKFRIFVLDLSFIGWILLGFLALFVGVLFVLPYINATKAELYLKLREGALENDLTTEEELLLHDNTILN
ncbi:DUF975 family protein [Paenibacillus sp. LHD-117]|uniref:DUF975 family protein n=1 Tax=Paenibacillus sp. LHD-117 TaxID=3071412 RepID=UPI0027DFFB34|nr:DUF975 family protein [Paenibacillus sp. LHD-117]MDQ6419347.1 DUF975 family protein [Paenibacillus sp. LHD-117]